MLGAERLFTSPCSTVNRNERRIVISFSSILRYSLVLVYINTTSIIEQFRLVLLTSVIKNDLRKKSSRWAALHHLHEVFAHFLCFYFSTFQLTRLLLAFLAPLSHKKLDPSMSSGLAIGVCRVVLAVEAALAVNNMGVRLLEQNCFNESRKSFQDSLQLMKVALDPNHTDGIDISHTLQVASARLSQSQAKPPLPHLTVTPFEYGDISRLDASFEFEPPASRFLPAFLRCDALDERAVEGRIDLYTAMILYNQSLAYLLLFCTISDTLTQGSMNITVLLKCSKACLRSSRELLSERIFRSQDMLEKLNMLVVVSLVIHRMTDCCGAAGSEEQSQLAVLEAQEAHHTWIQIRDYVREQLDGIFGVPGDCPAAAA
jgi:hypothetical protein